VPDIGEIPITGVANATQAVHDACFYDEHAVDLTWESFCREYKKEHGLDADDDMPDEVCDTYEHEEPEYIIGDWKLSDDGIWDIAPDHNNCGFSAITGYLGGACIVHVVWSRTTKRVLSMCSPCCPGQADLDSGEGHILTYALPSDYEWDGE